MENISQIVFPFAYILSWCAGAHKTAEMQKMKYQANLFYRFNIGSITAPISKG